MKPVKDLFHDLVDRRLWPVAALLAIAIVAVPVLLRSNASGAAEHARPRPRGRRWPPATAPPR